ncbi:MAG: MarR family EPS-associated transcriptional regulator [Proteobacteria bacterium]|nr:MarR family EPS-associated transcriptional regulator [Pseudomonadota bacterium]
MAELELLKFKQKSLRLSEPNHSSRQARLQEDTYFRVMRLLQDDPDLTQRELAQRLGVSVGGLNYCLRALIAKGWVKVQNFSHSKNKFGYVYVLTPRGIGEKTKLTHRFLCRKLEEYEALKQEIALLRRDADLTQSGKPN